LPALEQQLRQLSPFDLLDEMALRYESPQLCKQAFLSANADPATSNENTAIFRTNFFIGPPVKGATIGFHLKTGQRANVPEGNILFAVPYNGPKELLFRNALQTGGKKGGRVPKPARLQGSPKLQAKSSIAKR